MTISLSILLLMFPSGDPVLNIGEVASEFGPLEATDGQRYGLQSFQESNVLVVCFTCNSCPYSVDYEDRLIQLQKKYSSDSAVKIVAINSNGIEADSMERMKQRAKEKQFGFLYLKDPDQKVARQFGAVYTPEFFVLNQNRRLIYKGAFDDSTNADKAEIQYVDLATQAALQNKVPEVTAVGARGCTIRFQRSRRKKK